MMVINGSEVRNLVLADAVAYCERSVGCKLQVSPSLSKLYPRVLFRHYDVMPNQDTIYFFCYDDAYHNGTRLVMIYHRRSYSDGTEEFIEVLDNGVMCSNDSQGKYNSFVMSYASDLDTRPVSQNVGTSTDFPGFITLRTERGKMYPTRLAYYNAVGYHNTKGPASISHAATTSYGNTDTYIASWSINGCIIMHEDLNHYFKDPHNITDEEIVNYTLAKQ